MINLDAVRLLLYNSLVWSSLVYLPCSDSTMFYRVCHFVPLPTIRIEFGYRCQTLRLNESLHVTGNSWHFFLRTKSRIKIVWCASWNSTSNCVHFFYERILIGDRNWKTCGLNVICFWRWIARGCKNECIPPRKISLIILIWITLTAIKIVHIFCAWGNRKYFRWWGVWFILVG